MESDSNDSPSSPIDDLKSFLHETLPQQTPTAQGSETGEKHLDLGKMLDGTPLSRRGSTVGSHADDESDHEPSSSSMQPGGSTENDSTTKVYKDANTEKYAQNLATDPSLIAYREKMEARIGRLNNIDWDEKREKDGGDDKRSSSGSCSSPRKAQKKDKHYYVCTIWGLEVTHTTNYN